MQDNFVSEIETLYDYIECFEDSEYVKEKLDLILDTAFSSAEADDWSANERSDAIFVCRQTQQLIKALFKMRTIVTAFYLKRTNPMYEKERHI